MDMDMNMDMDIDIRYDKFHLVSHRLGKIKISHMGY